MRMVCNLTSTLAVVVVPTSIFLSKLVFPSCAKRFAGINQAITDIADSDIVMYAQAISSAPHRCTDAILLRFFFHLESVSPDFNYEQQN